MRTLLTFLIFFAAIPCFSQVAGDNSVTSDNSAQGRVSRNLVVLIGPEHFSKDVPEENDRAPEKLAGSDFVSIQYLYLKNRTVITAPLIPVRRFEVIRADKNKFYINLPRFDFETMFVDLDKVRGSIIATHAKIATISFQ